MYSYQGFEPAALLIRLLEYTEPPRSRKCAKNCPGALSRTEGGVTEEPKRDPPKAADKPLAAADSTIIYLTVDQTAEWIGRKPNTRRNWIYQG
jgi:hypothetical protein